MDDLPDSLPGQTAGGDLRSTSRGRLPRSTPEAEGISPASLLAFVERLEAQEGQPQSLMVLRHGAVVAEASWAPHRPDHPHQLYSVSKVAVAIAAGCAVEDGLLTLDEPLLDGFPEARVVAGPRAAAITVGDALGMVTGHLEDSLPRIADRAGVLLSASPACGFFGYEPEVEPGRTFTYDNGATILVAELVQRRAGQRLVDYLGPRVFEPLGIDAVAWHQWPERLDLGFSGLFLTTESVARLGLFLLAGGVWQNRQLVPRAWVELATSILASTPDGPHGPDWRWGYGLQVWHARSSSWMAYGAYGQVCLCVPSLDIVLVLLSSTADPQAYLDAFWEEMVPGVSSGPLPLDPRFGGALTDRLSGAARPARASIAEPTEGGPWRFVRSGATDLDTIVAITVARTAIGWELTAVEGDGTEVRIPCVDGAWPDAAGPFLASGGWTTPHSFEATIVAVETPHALALRCDVRSLAVEVDWDWYEAPWCWRTLSQLVAPRSTTTSV